MERTKLNEAKISYRFWREIVNTTLYILNRGKIRVNNNKTPYELWKGRPTIVKYFKFFRSKCYINRDDEDLGKFDSRADEGIFLGYSSRNKSYICYNTGLRKITESANIKEDEARHQKVKAQVNIQTDDPSCKEENEEGEIEQRHHMDLIKRIIHEI
jgi:hypothetical protein